MVRFFSNTLFFLICMLTISNSVQAQLASPKIQLSEGNIYLYEMYPDGGNISIKLGNTKGVCLDAGPRFNISLSLWQLMGEPIVQTHVTHDWPYTIIGSNSISMEFRTGIGEESELVCGRGKLLAKLDSYQGMGWQVDTNPYIHFTGPHGIIADDITLYGLSFVLGINPDTPLRIDGSEAYYAETFTGVMLDDGQTSFNVPGSPNWNRLFQEVPANNLFGQDYIGYSKYKREAEFYSAAESKRIFKDLQKKCIDANENCTMKARILEIKASFYPLISKLSELSEGFKEGWWNSQDEQLASELVAGYISEDNYQDRQDRQIVTEKVLKRFEYSLPDHMHDTWAEAKKLNTYSYKKGAEELQTLSERITDELRQSKFTSKDSKEELNDLKKRYGGYFPQEIALLEGWLNAKQQTPIANKEPTSKIKSSPKSKPLKTSKIKPSQESKSSKARKTDYTEWLSPFIRIFERPQVFEIQNNNTLFVYKYKYTHIETVYQKGPLALSLKFKVEFVLESYDENGRPAGKSQFTRYENLIFDGIHHSTGCEFEIESNDKVYVFKNYTKRSSSSSFNRSFKLTKKNREDIENFCNVIGNNWRHMYGIESHPNSKGK